MSFSWAHRKYISGIYISIDTGHLQAIYSQTEASEKGQVVRQNPTILLTALLFSILYGKMLS